MLVKDGKTKKAVLSEKYNYVFDKKTGYFARWGKTIDDDPEFAPSNEILDLECTTICSGVTCPDGVERVSVTDEFSSKTLILRKSLSILL